MTEHDHNVLAHAAWEAKADFWDALHGDEGNVFHRYLVGPAAERLLAIQPGEVVLDLACGNGVFARRLAELGAEVIGTDFSAGLLERARARTTATTVTYQQLDATDEDAMLALGAGRFDAVVCNMALMDIADIEPLLRTLPRLLKPGGRWVFTLSHPCFNNPSMIMVHEEIQDAGRLVDVYALKITHYLDESMTLAVGSSGEPTPHPDFHRPLSLLFGLCFRHGWVIDGLEEPAFPPDVESRRPLSWTKFPQFPPVLGVRLRPAR